MSEVKTKSRFMSTKGARSVMTAFIGFVALFIIFSVLSSNFRTPANVQNLLRQIAPILIIGLGQGFVLLTGNIDLSIGSVVGMVCMTAGTLMTNGMNPLFAILLALAMGLVVGVLNGILVAKFKLPAFIGTLGTMTLARGIAQLVNNNRNTDFIGTEAQWFRDSFYYGDILKVYNAFWLGLILLAVFYFVLSKTKYGRHVYAVGSNINAARLSGVKTDNIVLSTYVVSSFCASMTGLMLLASAGMGTMDAGGSYEMYAVAACVIGGISTLGGSGILLGVLPGAAIWGILQNGLHFVGAPVALRNIVIGIIVILAVLLDIVRGTSVSKKG